MPTYKNIYQYLYNCPIVELSGYTARLGLSGRIYAYLDFGGPTGTAKDGLAEGMLSLASKKGKLQKGQPIIEADSGPFAAALCIAGRRSGHSVTLVVPPTLDGQRQQLLQQLGAKLIFSMDSFKGGREAVWEQTRKLAEEQGAYFVDQFNNDNNPDYHRRLTGPAILKATNNGDAIDAIVAGVGTGGTITGVGEYIKAWTNHIRIAAVEPYECQAIGGGFLSRHGIPGIGFGFVPQNYNPYVVDILMAVPTGEALNAAREVLCSDAIPAGPSAGAALFAARQLLEQGRSKSALCIFGSRRIAE